MAAVGEGTQARRSGLGVLRLLHEHPRHAVGLHGGDQRIEQSFRHRVAVLVEHRVGRHHVTDVPDEHVRPARQHEGIAHT
nr:hypothetical protein GCM10020063_001230 [Dactylosporangium thailandense]